MKKLSNAGGKAAVREFLGYIASFDKGDFPKSAEVLTVRCCLYAEARAGYNSEDQDGSPCAS